MKIHGISKVSSEKRYKIDMRSSVPPHSIEELCISIGCEKRRVYLRTGTSDTEMVGQIFVDEAFTLAKLPRRNEFARWLSACRRGGKRPLIVDAGANVGLSALMFYAQIADATVVAIEPDPENFALLVANTEGTSILPLPAALGGATGRVVVTDPGRGAWGIQTMAGPAPCGSTLVPVVTVDEIVSVFSERCQPCIVKIDIEGFEAEVFAAGGEWLDQVPLVIVELHDWMLLGARTSHVVLHRLLQSDRDFVIVGENLFCMLNEMEKSTCALIGKFPDCESD